MKEGWEYIAFKDVYHIKMGKTPPRGDKSSWDEKKETHNKWVSIADISNNEGKIIKDTKEYISDSAAEKINKVSKGSLLMSFKLSIGRMAFAGDDLYTNEAIIAIPESNKFILRFIYYYLLQYNWLSLTEGNEKVKGATLNKTSIGKIQLPVLSLSEQQSIVDYLDSAFAKIDAMKANAEKALNEAKALFQASLKEMLEPKEGWENKTIEHFARIVHGKNQKEVLDSNGSYPIYDSGGNIMGYANAYLCEAGSTILGRKGTIDNPLFIDERFWNVDTAFGIIAKDNCNKKYLYYSIKKVDWAKLNTGTTLPSLTQNVVYNIAMCAPSLSEQQSIVATLDSLKSKVDRLKANYEKISQECDALKQTILRQVFE